MPLKDQLYKYCLKLPYPMVTNSECSPSSDITSVIELFSYNS